MLPDLLRDLGTPFPAIWEQLHGAHGPREAARLFAKVLGQLDTHGAAVVVPALRAALATGTPLLLALTGAGIASSATRSADDRAGVASGVNGSGVARSCRCSSANRSAIVSARSPGTWWLCRPGPLRDIEVASGCAADYDSWLVEVAV